MAPGCAVPGQPGLTTAPDGQAQDSQAQDSQARDSQARDSQARDSHGPRPVPGGDSLSWRHPVVISGLTAAAGAVTWMAVFPRVGTDLSAALARAGWASAHPRAAYLFSWYGGFHPAGYSLLAPYLMAAVGTRLAMALATVVSAVVLTSLLVRHQVPRPMVAGLWVAAALWTELSAGRAAFTLGIAAAVGCVAVADISRPRSLGRLAAAAALALLTCLLSPVAAIFLGLAAVTFVLAGHWAEGIAVAVAAAVPLGVMAMFADGGTQPFGPQNWVPPLIAVAALLLLVPRRWRLVRAGAVLYGIAIVLTRLEPSLIGSNIERLGELLAGPLLAGIGGARHRWLFALALAGAMVWLVAQPAADLSQGNAPAYSPQTAALVRELVALRADTGRVEAVPQYGHWEAQQLASVAPLARGWERQLDIERNPLFYTGVLTPPAYYQWLRYNAVGYVAISAATPDFAAVAEAAIVRAGQPWLVPVWHDAFWTLYRVAGASPLASPPAVVTRTTPAQITLRMSRAGTAVVRVRWSPLLRAAGAAVGPDGPWTRIRVLRPGLYTLSASY
jgi:hypothetical protein